MENSAKNSASQPQDTTDPQSPSRDNDNTPREGEEINNNTTYNDKQADILAKIKVKATQKHANNIDLPSLPTYSNQEYTPTPPNGFPTVHGKDPLWTLNNVASPQVSDWFHLDGAKIVALIEKEVSHKAERAASLADALARDIDKNFQISGTKAIYGYMDIITNTKWDESPYAFCIFNLPNRVVQDLISARMWRSKCLCYTCFPPGLHPPNFCWSSH